MKTKIGRKITAVLMGMCILLGLGPALYPVTEVKAESKNYLYEVKSAVGNDRNDTVNQLSGYTVINDNLNEGVGGSYVGVGYKSTTNRDQAITGLILRTDGYKNDTLSYGGRTYYLDPGARDLNYGTNHGDKVYLYYTKEANPNGTTEYLTSLDAVVCYTSNAGLRGKDYSTVIGVSTGKPMDVNSGHTYKDPIWLVYESEMADESKYQGIGNEELKSTVNGANSVNYYDFGNAYANSDFFAQAMMHPYEGVSAVESWAQVFYSMLGVKGRENGYQDRLNEGFDKIFGAGRYVDFVSALKSGTGTKNMANDRVFVQSTGVKTANSLAEVYDVMGHSCETLPNDTYFDTGDYGYGEMTKNVFHQDFLKNNMTSQDVVYTMCRVADDKAASGHDKAITVFGMAFYNFRLIPLVGDSSDTLLLNYADTVENPVNTGTNVKMDINNTAASVSSSNSFSNSISTSTQNQQSETFNQSYSFTEGITAKAGYSIPVGFSAEVSLNLSASQAFGYSDTSSTSETMTTTQTSTSGLSYTVPPYSLATVEQTSADTNYVQNYDNPVAITYDVVFFSTGADIGKTDAFHTSYSYVSNYYATLGDNSGKTAVDVLKELNLNGGNSDAFHASCSGQNNFNGYSSGEWNSILNKVNSDSEYGFHMPDTINFLTGNQPMSYSGGSFKTDAKSVSYNFQSYYAMYPIDRIRVFKNMAANENQQLVTNISLVGEGDYRLTDYFDSIKAYDQNNAEWTGWVSTQGSWVLVSGDQEIPITVTPVSDGYVKAWIDETSGAIHMEPQENGTSYVRYIINDDVFRYYPAGLATSDQFNPENLTYISNADIKNKGTIELKISGMPKNFDKDEQGRYEINTYEDLEKMANLVQEKPDTYGKAQYILCSNIYAPEGSAWTKGIGSVSQSKPFNGTFDGNGYIICGLNITAGKNGSQYGGLFEYIGPEGTVKNLHMMAVTYSGATKVAGSVAAVNEGTIRQCIDGINLTTGVLFIDDKEFYISKLNSTIEGEVKAGGIVAENRGTVEGSRSAAAVSTEGTGGGIAAENYGTISNGTNTGVVGSNYGAVAGGIAGVNEGLVKVSFNTGRVSSRQQENLGAIAGHNSGTYENVYYLSGMGADATGSASSAVAQATAMTQNEMKSDAFCDTLNQAAQGEFTWAVNSKINAGYPAVALDYLTQKTIETESGFKLSGMMHAALNATVESVDKKTDEYKALAKIDKLTDAIVVQLTDQKGNTIPEEFWYSGDLEVTIPNTYGTTDLTLYVLDGENNPVKVENAVITDTSITFTSGEFTEIGVVKNTAGSDNQNNTENNKNAENIKTGDNSNILIPAVVFVAAMMIIGGVVIVKTKKRSSEKGSKES